MKINLFKFYNFNEIEKEFELHFLDYRIKQFVIAIGIAVFAASILSLNDFVLCKQWNTLVTTLLGRLGFIIISVFSIVLVKKNPSVRIFNYVTFAWLFITCALSLYITATRPNAYVFGFVWDVLILLVIFLMVPASMVIQLFVAFCYSLGLSIIWYIEKIPYLGAAALNSLALALMMVNLIGAIFSWQLKRSACKEFFLYKKDQEIKEKLNQQNEAKNKFFSIISHDLRSPVGNIISICNMAKEANTIPHEKLIGLINDGAKMAYSLLENLLAWAQSESEQLIPAPTEINVPEFISEKILLFKHNTLSKHISIQYNDIAEIKAYADYNMLETVLRNLLSNAVKFTPEGGSINVSAEKKNGMIEISVQDNGVGIDQDILPKLFNIDFHHSTVGVNNETGNGIGLKLCKEFIAKNGGDLWAKSKKGVGSTFTFSIPVLCSNP